MLSSQNKSGSESVKSNSIDFEFFWEGQGGILNEENSALKFCPHKEKSEPANNRQPAAKSDSR
jgi:hypothetical protein